MKKFRGIIILLVLAIICMLAFMYFGHSAVRIKSNKDILNAKCTYESGKIYDFENKSYLYHSSYIYGQYNYTFNLDVDGKIITPTICIFKTNNWEHTNVKIDIQVNKTAIDGQTIYDAIVKVIYNGHETEEQFEDIMNNEIYVKTGI